MKHKVPDGVEVWKQFEDLLIPGLRLSMSERGLYSHLLRHSRLEGKDRLQFSIGWLARGAGLGVAAARGGVRRLAAKGALRLAEKSKRGHTIEVRLPAEVRGLRARKTAGRGAKRLRGAANLEKADFLGNRALREAIHARGRLLFLLPAAGYIGDAVHRSHHSAGEDGMEWLSQPGIELSECNSQKGERRAEDFQRWLYREGRLESGELKERLRALEKMAAGKMRPAVNGKTRTPEAARPERGGWG